MKTEVDLASIIAALVSCVSAFWAYKATYSWKEKENLEKLLELNKLCLNFLEEINKSINECRLYFNYMCEDENEEYCKNYCGNFFRQSIPELEKLIKELKYRNQNTKSLEYLFNIFKNYSVKTSDVSNFSVPIGEDEEQFDYFIKDFWAEYNTKPDWDNCQLIQAQNLQKKIKFYLKYKSSIKFQKQFDLNLKNAQKHYEKLIKKHYKT